MVDIINQEHIKELSQLLNGFKESLNEVNKKLVPIIDKVKENDIPTSNGISFLDSKYHLLLNYCIHLCLFILMKLEGKQVNEHPLIKDLARIRVTIEKLRPIDDKLKYQIDKLMKIASSGSVQAVDPKLTHKANIRNFMPLDQEMVDENGEVIVDEEDLKNKKYVVPKISAVAFEGSKEKREKEKKRAEKRAKQSAMGKFLIEEFGDQPIENPLTIGDEFNPELDKEERDKLRYEEEMFIRLQRTKKELKKRKKLVIPDELEELANFSDLKRLEQLEGDDDFGLPKAKRSKKSKKKKKRF